MTNENLNIRLVRLTTGEELLAHVVNEKADADDKIVVSNPVVLVRTSESSLGLMEWLPYAKKPESIELNSAQVVFIIEAADQMVEQYNKLQSQRDTGLVTPEKPKLLV